MTLLNLLTLALLAISPGPGDAKPKAAAHHVTAHASPSAAACRTGHPEKVSFQLDHVPLWKAAQLVSQIACEPVLVEPGLENRKVMVATPKGARYTVDQVLSTFGEALALDGMELQRKDASIVLARHH